MVFDFSTQYRIMNKSRYCFLDLLVTGASMFVDMQSHCSVGLFLGSFRLLVVNDWSLRKTMYILIGPLLLQLKKSCSFIGWMGDDGASRDQSAGQ